MIAEDYDAAVAAASPMSVIAPMGPPYWGDTAQAERRGRPTPPDLDLVAQRLQFQADLNDRLAKVDDRLTALARTSSPEQLQPLRRVRNDLERDRMSLATLPDEYLNDAIRALDEGLERLERALADLDAQGR